MDFFSRGRRLKTEPARRGFSLNLDLPESLLIFFDIVLQRIEKEFGVLGRRDDPGMYSSLGDTGEDSCKIDHEFCRGVSDNGEVGIDSFRFLLSQLDIDLLLLWNLISHGFLDRDG